MKKWHIVRIFISSTFRDMHAEREELVRAVFPELRERCKRYKVLVEDIDLRWGVTEEQNAPELCRAEVEQCTIFICLLGERYGSIFAPVDISVTHQEINYAALEQKPSFFYFRALSASQQIPTTKRKDYWEETDSVKAQNLANLKKKIQSENFPICEYSCQWNDAKAPSWNLEKPGYFEGLEAFGKQVVADVTKTIAAMFPEDRKKKGFLEEEREAIEYFIAARTKIFVGRSENIEKLNAFAKSEESGYLMVTGVSGSGKSSLLAKFCQQYKQSCTFIPYFVGSSVSSSYVVSLLRYIYLSLQENQSDTDLDYNELRELVPKLLAQKAQQKPIVIVIDAVNQLSNLYDAHKLYWLPEQLPQGVKCIISTLPGACEDALKNRYIKEGQHLAVNPLNKEECLQIIADYLGQYGKSLEPQAAQELLNKKESGHPLYLKVALEECRTLGGNEMHIKIIDIIHQLPQDVPGLFAAMFLRLEQEFGVAIVTSLLSTLACARGGMLATELKEIIQDKNNLPPVVWARLYRLLQPYLIERMGLIDFFHQQIGEAVAAKYLSVEKIQQAHGHIAKYFGKQGYGYSRTLAELPYHLLQAKNWSVALKTLCDWEFLEKKCKEQMIAELLRDWQMALAQLPNDTRTEIASGVGVNKQMILWMEKALSMELQFIMRHPQCLFQIMWNYGYWHDCPNAKHHYRNKDNALWDLQQDKMHLFVEHWRKEKEKTQDFTWLKSFRPLINRLDSPLSKVFRGHSGEVKSVCWNSDGSCVISGAKDGTVRLWDSNSGDYIHILSGHQDIVNGVCYQAQRSLVISASKDSTVRVWEIQTGKCLQILKTQAAINGVCCYGSHIACGLENGSIQIWQNFKPSQVFQLPQHTKPIYNVCFHPQGTFLAAACLDGTIQIWDMQSGQWVQNLVQERAVIALCYSPDGSHIAAGYEDNKICIWELATNNCRTFLGHDWMVRSVAYSPDGSFLVSGSEDSTMRIWDSATGECLHVLREHERHIHQVCYNATGTHIASCSFDGTVRLWNVKESYYSGKVEIHPRIITKVDGNSQKTLLASTALDETVRLWEPKSGQCQQIFYGEQGKICAARSLPGFEKDLENVCFSPDNKKIAAGFMNGKVVLWDVATKECLYELTEHKEWVKSVAFSPDAKLLASASNDATVRIWDAHQGLCLHVCPHQWQVVSLCFSPDGSLLASASLDETACLWDTANGNCRYVLKGHENFVGRICFNADGTYVATASDDATIRVWEANSGNCLTVLKGHKKRVNRIAFNAQNQIVSSSRDNTMRIWDLATGQCIETFVGQGNPQAIVREKYKVLEQEIETVVLDEHKQKIAWFPTLIEDATAIGGNIFTGYSHHYLYILELCSSR